MIREKVAPEGGFSGGLATKIAASGSSDLILAQLLGECNTGCELVTVVDRRVGSRFSMDLRVVDEWRAVVGLAGIGLYALYCRLAMGGVTAGREPWVVGGEVDHLHRLLLFSGLVQVDVDGAIVLTNPPVRSVGRLRRLETVLYNALAREVSPTWTRSLARVKALLREGGGR